MGGDLHEPGSLTFSLILSAVHSEPFIVLSALSARQPSGWLSLAAAAWTVVAVAVLLLWAFTVVNEDAQAGLVYVFVTPPAAWIIAGTALAGVLLQRVIWRRASTPTSSR